MRSPSLEWQDRGLTHDGLTTFVELVLRQVDLEPYVAACWLHKALRPDEVVYTDTALRNRCTKGHTISPASLGRGIAT